MSTPGDQKNLKRWAMLAIVSAAVVSYTTTSNFLTGMGLLIVLHFLISSLWQSIETRYRNIRFVWHLPLDRLDIKAPDTQNRSC